MKSIIAVFLCVVSLHLGWAAPFDVSALNEAVKKTYRFEDVAYFYYFARDYDYSDGNFLNLSGKIDFAISDKRVDIDALLDSEENPRSFSIIVTNKFEDIDSQNNKIMVYRGFYAGDTTRTTITLELGKKYASITREFYSRTFYDFFGQYAKSNSGTGSGFAVNSNIIVTNQHVVDGNKYFFASREDLDSLFIDLELVYEDRNLDLAVLKSKKKLNGCAIDRKIYDIGSEVVAYGFPQIKEQGRSLKATKGIISSRKGYKDDVKTYQIDAAIQPGNSGGPLVKGDKVVGVVVSYLRESQNVNYAIKSNFLGAVLDVLKIPNTGKAKPKDCTYTIISIDKKWIEENAKTERNHKKEGNEKNEKE